jgi:ubiquitin-protein ligase
MGLNLFTDAANTATKDCKDVGKILDLVAAAYNATAPQLESVPQDDYVEEDGDAGEDPNADEYFVYDEGTDTKEALDTFVKQTSVVFTATQRGTLSAEAARVITKEYNSVKKQEATLPFRILGETESDISKWVVEIHDFKDSSLATQIRQRGVPGVLVQVCFPNEYPRVPPLVRIVGPRLKYLSGNVTFSGVVCLEELSSAVWTPAFGIAEVMKRVRDSLILHDARLDIRTRAGYTSEEAEATAMQRQVSVSQYNRPFRHLQPRKLFAFRFESKNRGNRVELPGSLFEHLVRDLSANLPPVIVFMIETPQFRTFCGVDNFNAREGIVHMPHWMMENMLLRDGDPVTMRLVQLPLLEHVKFKPLEYELVNILEESRLQGIFGTSACPLVRAIEMNFVPFTMGDTIQVWVNDKPYHLFIMKTKPTYTGILPQDGRSHDLKIEFCTAVDMDTAAPEDPPVPPVAPAPPPPAPAPLPAPVVHKLTEGQSDPAATTADVVMCPLCGKNIAAMSIVLHQNRCNGKGAEVEIARRREKEREEAELKAKLTKEEEERRLAEEKRQKEEVARRVAEAEREIARKRAEELEREAIERRKRMELERAISEREGRNRGVAPSDPSPARGGAKVDHRKAPPCQYYWSGGCRNGADCEFGHGSEPTRGTVVGDSDASKGIQRSKGGSGKACIFFMAGNCRNGANCTDEHHQAGGKSKK